MNAKQILTILAILSVFVAPITVFSVSETNAAPPGYAGIPNQNIASNIPDHAKNKMPDHVVDKLKGRVLASKNPETLSVSVTTHAKAHGRANACKNKNNGNQGQGNNQNNKNNDNKPPFCSDPTFALKLSDNTNHNGRSIALPKDTLHDILGYKPNLANIEHSSGNRYIETIEENNGYYEFNIKRFSSNTVTFSGQVELTGSPASHNTQYTYKIEDLDSADNFSINLTGTINKVWDNISFGGLSDGATKSISIGGNLDPTGPSSNNEPEITFTGNSNDQWNNQTKNQVGSGTYTYTVDGNLDPTGPSSNNEPEITIEENGYDSDQTYSKTDISGGTQSISIDGDLDPSGPNNNEPEITFTGNGDNTQHTYSKSSISGGTQSISIPGDIDPSGPSNNNEPEITFTGNGQNNQKTYSKTGITGGTQSISIGGELDPIGPNNNEPEITFTASGHNDDKTQSNSGLDPSATESLSIGGDIQPSGHTNTEPQLSVTGNSDPQKTYSLSSDTGDGGHDSYLKGFGSGTSAIHSSHLLHPNVDGTIIDVSVDTLQSGSGSSYDPCVDIYMSQDSSTDTNWKEGTKVKDCWNPPYTEEIHTATFDTTFEVDSSNTYELEFYTTSSNGEFSYWDFRVEDSATSTHFQQGGAESSSWNYYGDITITREQEDVTNLDVADGTGTTVSFGDFTDGETKTKSIDLSTSSSNLDFSGGQFGTIDYTLDYTERYRTQNPGVDIDGDGTDEASVSGTMNIDETSTKQLSELSTSTTSIDSSVSGEPFNYTIDYTERHRTKNPSVDLGGDGTTDASYTGTLNIGGSVTKELSELSTSTSNIDTSVTGSPVDYTINYTSRNRTIDPSVDVDGDGNDEASYTGTMSIGETSTHQISELSTTTTEIDPTVTGSPLDYTIDYTERYRTKDVGLDVDGDGTDEVSHSGAMNLGETNTYEISQLSKDTSDIDVSVSGQNLNYTVRAKERHRTEDPSIDVNNDDVADAQYNGILNESETSTKELAEITKNTADIDITNTGEPVDIEIQLQERTETENPKIEVNDNNWANHTGTLSDGTETSLNTNTSWLQTGTNTVNISVAENLGSDAPTGHVDLTYKHRSIDDKSVNYTANEWTEEYNFSRTWGDDTDNPEIDIPFKDNVVQISSLEKQINNGGWSSVSDNNYNLNGNDLNIQLDSVSQGDTVEIRTTGRKVRVKNGDINVTNPTTKGNDLDSKFKITNKTSDFHLEVGPTNNGDRLHYIYEESWSNPDHYVEFSGGSQELYLPNSLEDGTTRISTVPLDIQPQSGEVKITVTDPANKPTWEVEPGSNKGDKIDFVYPDSQTTTGQKYLLWSTSSQIQRDSVVAQSPITLTTTDDSDTLTIKEETSSSSSDGGGGSGSGGVGGIGGTGTGTGGTGVPVPQETSGILSNNAFLFAGLIALLGGIYYFRNQIPGLTPTSGSNRNRGFITKYTAKIISTLRKTISGVFGLAREYWKVTSALSLLAILLFKPSAILNILLGLLENPLIVFVSILSVAGVVYYISSQILELSMRLSLGFTFVTLILGVVFGGEQLGAGILGQIGDAVGEVGTSVVFGVLLVTGYLFYKAIQAYRKPDKKVTLRLGGDDE